MKNRFTIPKVKHYPLESTKDWYVWFRFNGGNPIRIKTGLNKIQDYNERLEEATALAEVLKEKLENGWIPNAANIYKSSIEKLTLYSALDFALEKKKSQLAHKSFLDYKCTCRFVKVYAKKMKFDRMYVNSCERFHIKKIFDKLQLDRNWTAKNYNKHLGYIKSLFSELVEWELISSNPVRDIRTQKEEKTESNIPLTDEEHKIVFDFLKERNYNFYVYCSFIYHCGIRPYELTQIKCKYINLEENLISLPAEITKNDSDGFVSILGNLKDLEPV
ncbi:hypothetical protein GNY06_04810 [Elizabethkingia argentiflava]|uniref:Core-binding (CB) domain-containing protein n=1 Tax=Elizabethkingia argenteiflava TaxID=2681556 RepID=A0A845PRA3_9FLAO|nr:hypothetical protein [Elizabethkingia argenteiflava]NAW50732.1 hypothetical protein [Elizabethkingia argenteiflava]